MNRGSETPNQDRIACADVRDALPEFVAGDVLATGLSARLWRHLHRCSACRSDYSGFRQSQAALDELAPPAREPAAVEAWFDVLADDIVAATVGAGVAEVSVADRQPGRSGRRAVAAMAAAVFLALASWVGWSALEGQPGANRDGWVDGANLLDMPALWTESVPDSAPPVWGVSRSEVMPVAEVQAPVRSTVRSGLGARLAAEAWVRHVYQLDLLGATLDAARAVWR